MHVIKRLLNSSLVKSSGVYTITNVLNKAIPFLLLPILTRYLSPEEYGIVAMFAVMVGITTPFTGFNIHGAITRKYYDQEEINLPIYVTNCIYILLTTTLIVSIVYFLFRDLIAEYSDIPVKWLWVVVLMSFAQFLARINLSLWIVQVKSFAYGSFQISQTILKFILAIILVVVLGMGWQGQVASQAIAVSAFAILGLIFIFKDGWLSFNFNWNYIKHALKFGTPLIPHTLSVFMINMTDRILITNMVGIDQTGYYVVGYQIGMIVNIIAESFHKAWTPWLFSKLKMNSLAEKKKIIKISYIYILFLILLAIIISILGPLLFGTFISSEFNSSIQFILWISLGYSFNGIYRVFVDYIFYVEKTKILAVITFSVGLLNIGLNYILILIYGALGAAISTTIIYLFKSILVYFISKQLFPMPTLRESL